MHKNKTVLCEIANIYKPTKQIKKGKIMKKFLTLLALIIATVTAYATDYTDNAVGKFGNYSNNYTNKTVTVTETSSGIYTFVVNALDLSSYKPLATFTMEGVEGKTNSDNSISYSYSGNAKTTSVNNGATTMLTEGGSKSVTMTATSKDGKLYMVLNFTMGTYNVSCSYTFGSEITVTEPTEPTETPVTYTANAIEKYNNLKYDFVSQKVDITKTGDNTYKVVYKDLYLNTNEIGDFTAEGVKGVEDADGNINYTFSGKATVSNIGTVAGAFGVTEGGEVPFTMEGTSNGDVLKAQFNITLTNSSNTYSFVILYNGYTETMSPTIVAGEEPAGTSTTVVEGKDTGGSSYSISNIAIDWETQKLVASIDVTGKTNSWKFALVVGENLSTSGPNFRIQLNGSSMNVYSQGMSRNTSKTGVGVSNNTIRVEISKAKGIVVNGTNCTVYSNSVMSESDIATYLSNIWNAKTIMIGNTYGNNMAGDVKYNYIRILDKDSESDSGAAVETNAVTLAESTSGDDMATTLSGYNGTCMYSLTLTRTLVANAWNTLCLPFDVPATGLTSLGDVVIKKYKSVTGTTMYLEDATEIEAGQPYLIKPAANIKNTTFQYATISSTEPTTAGTGDYQFVGVYGTKTFSDTDAQTSYILVSGGSLVNPTANTTMKGMRAYFTYTGKSEVAPRLVIDGVETALTEVVGKEEVSDGRIYNLRGMYVGNDASRLAKGIYIMNGKKVVLK